jgi:RHS repeat-associated protein
MKKIVLLTALLFSFISNSQVSNRTMPPDGGGGTTGNASTSTGNSSEVGATAGQLSVSLSGAANYNLPIAIPPGINGVEPKISLSYSSQSSAGLAGYGWNIGGLSAITRVPSTKFHDGINGTVNMNTADKFALNGQRLMLKSGTYGVAGSVYETESFSNLKITLLANGSNLYFKAEYPDGSSAYYGYSSDSKVGDLVYNLTYWENPQNIKITYTYNITNNYAYIVSIKYGSNLNNTPLNEVQFIYKNRARNQESYHSGINVINSKVLSEINVKSNNFGYRNYLLTHNLILNYERLIKVTERNGDITKSYNPTVFSYDENTISTELSYIPKNDFINLPSYTFQNLNGDFDGDGSSDMIVSNGGGSLTKLITKISDDQSSPTIDILPSASFYPTITLKCLEQNSNGYSLMNRDAWCYEQTPSSIKRVFPIYSKDIINNLIKLEYTKEVNLSNAYNCKNISGDFNGDKLTDIIIFEKFHTSSNYNVLYVNLDRRLSTNYVNNVGVIDLQLYQLDRISVADFDGDGKSDILIYYNDKIKVYTIGNNQNLMLLWETPINVIFSEVTNAGSQTVDNYVYIFGTDPPQYTNVPGVYPNGNLYQYPSILGDFNGDGKADILLPGANRILLISTGNAFVSEQLPFNFPSRFDLGRLLTLDFNNDGKTEFIRIKNRPSIVGLYDVQTFQRISNQFWQNDNKPLRTFIDRLDKKSFMNPLIMINSKTYPGKNALLIGEVIYNQGNPNPIDLKLSFCVNQESLSFKTNLITQVTQGNGNKEKITYTQLENNNGIYSTINQPIEFYPNYSISNSLGFNLVSKLERISTSVYKKKLYKYFGASGNIDGLGFLGFKSILTTNWFDNDSQAISTITKYDVSKRGAPFESFTALGILQPTSVLHPTDPFLSKTFYSYNYNPITNDYDSPILSNFVFKLRNTSIFTINGLENTTNEIISEYDTYNLIKKTTNIYDDLTGLGKTSIEDYTFDNLPNSTPYFIGRIKDKRTELTTSTNGDSSVSEESYTYDNNLIKQIKKRATNSGQVTDLLTESNDYDIYGNITKKTLSSTGVADRLSNFEYDSTNRFLTKKIDLQGLVTTYTYNLNNGLILTENLPSTTGFPIKTVFNYDTWGKKITETNYLGTSITTNSTIAYTNTTSGGIIKTITRNDGIVNKTIYDELGRKSHEGVKNITGNWSYTSTYYDNNDKPIITSLPYYESFDGLGTFDVWNEMQYDVYGRLIQTNHLKSDQFEGKITTYEYNGLLVSENDGQKTKLTQKSATGEVVSITEMPIGGSGESVNYTYFANGNLKTTTSSGVDITIIQDGWGRKKTLIDPSAGTYNYSYNNFGELLSEEVVGKGTTTYNLDNFGRVTSKVVSGTVNNNVTTTSTNTTTTYTYNPTSKLLTSKLLTDASNNYSISYTYGYDNFKRLNSTIESRTGSFIFQKDYTFDAYGRKDKEHFYAKDQTTNKVSDKWIKYTYQNGFPWQIYDMTSSTVVGTTKLWQNNTVNPQGKVLTATLGNGITISNNFDLYGFPTQIKHQKGTTNIMTLGTTFDPIYGNLLNRISNLFGVGSWNENITYDTTDRLTTFNDNLGSQTQEYNANGTIASNTVGEYAYMSNKPYTLSSVTPIDQTATSPTLLYYTGRKQNIGYNLFKSPVTIIEEGKENIDFEYNDENKRSVMYYGDTQVNKNSRMFRKFYSVDGTIEIKRKTVGTTTTNEFITYIGGDGYSAPVILRYDGTNYGYNYLHRDYQGTIVAITNSTGVVVEKRWFDVWGSMLKYSYGANTTVPTNSSTMFLDRGYTGHEHLLGVGLINMNGRVYDNKLHKFLQPDNNIQDPYNVQNYNRYGYVMNNPTKYSDSSGEFWDVVLGFLASAYIHGAQATGEANPFKWNAGQWANATMAPFSAIASYNVTNYTNNYINNYNSHPEIVMFETPNNNAEDHGYVADSWISPPTQHHFLGVNMTAMSEGNLFEQGLYGVANQFNIVCQYLMLRSVNDSSMRNLNGTPTTTADGVMAFGTIPLWFAGGGGSVKAAERSIKLLPQFSSSTIDDAVLLTMKQKELHIFANKLHPKPWLNELSQQMGGNQNIIKSALQNANGRILPDAQGVFNTPVNIGPVNFTIRGYINQGTPIINSIFIP